MLKRFLHALPDGTRLYSVDGAQIRSRRVEFVQGGHGYVYSWIPKNEIWIERMLDHTEECYIQTHEVVEQQLMKLYGLSYDDAHELADEIEQQHRRNGTCLTVDEAFELGARRGR